MTPRFICPHCHSPIDPQTLENAASAGAQYRICPECDDLIVFSLESIGDSLPPPLIEALHHESVVQ